MQSIFFSLMNTKFGKNLLDKIHFWRSMFYIEWLDQFNRWNKYSSYHHLPTAYKIAANRAKLKAKKHRIIDRNTRLIDLFEP